MELYVFMKNYNQLLRVLKYNLPSSILENCESLSKDKLIILSTRRKRMFKIYHYYRNKFYVEDMYNLDFFLSLLSYVSKNISTSSEKTINEQDYILYTYHVFLKSLVILETFFFCYSTREKRTDNLFIHIHILLNTDYTNIREEYLFTISPFLSKKHNIESLESTLDSKKFKKFSKTKNINELVAKLQLLIKIYFLYKVEKCKKAKIAELCKHDIIKVMLNLEDIDIEDVDSFITIDFNSKVSDEINTLNDIIECL